MRTADFAASRSGNRRIDFALLRFSLRRDFRFMTCGLQTPQANDPRGSLLTSVRVARHPGAAVAQVRGMLGSAVNSSPSGARCRDSRCMRYRRTTVLLKDSHGSEQYHSMNSSMACAYPRWASIELRLFETADFAWSR